jgi:hypothetical protein
MRLMNSLMKTAGMILLGIGVASLGLAQTAPAPEIDAATGMNAIALLSGAVLLIRGRKR